MIYFPHLLDRQSNERVYRIYRKTTCPDEHTIELNLKVDNSDIGKVIGKHGNTVNAMRTLLIAVGAKGGHRATLQILGGLPARGGTKADKSPFAKTTEDKY